jgi:protease I
MLVGNFVFPQTAREHNHSPHNTISPDPWIKNPLTMERFSLTKSRTLVNHDANTLIGTDIPSNSMKILIAVAPEKFRDEELAVPVAAFKKAGIAFDIASTRRGPCIGMLGAKTTATLSFKEVDPKLYGGLVIIGGAGSQLHLWNDDLLVQLVKNFHESRKIVAAICLAPVVLARSGILQGLKATCFESLVSVKEMKSGGAVLVNKPVVMEGRIITANGPAAAQEFADTILRTITQVGR